MVQFGITPAGAGKTPYITYEVATDRDHPRRCGENCAEQHAVMKFEGSPPQVRGKLSQFVILPEQVGITPAGAGKTTAPCTEGSRDKDHPRRCGENTKKIL